MIRTPSFIKRPYQKFITFYQRHAGQDWQQVFTTCALVMSAAALAIAAITYGVIFFTTGHPDAGIKAIDLAAAKIIVTVFFLLHSKKLISFGGPALVIIYLLLGGLLAIQHEVDAVAMAAFSISALLAGLLYGFWCSLLPASLGTVLLLGLLASELQNALRAGHAGMPSNSQQLVIAIHIMYSCGILGAFLHNYYQRIWERRERLKQASLSATPKNAVISRPAVLLVGSGWESMRKGLKQTFDCTFAGTQSLAKAKFNPAAYQLVVINLDLPAGSGYTICREIRHQQADVPILVIADKADKKAQLAIFEAGADDYMVKPLDVRSLTVRMNALARRNGLAGQPLLFTHDLLIDTRKREVKRGSTDIPLRRKEYDILEYLIKNKGQITTKAMLFNNIWRQESQPDSLGVHMKYLRDKVDKPFDTQLIDTLHGVGYVVKDLPAQSEDPS